MQKPLPPRPGGGGAQAEPPGLQAGKAVLALALFLLLGCAQASEPRSEGPAFLRLLIQPRGARLFLPDGAETASYRLTGSGPGGLGASAESTLPSFSLELEPGPWILTVEGLGSGGLPLSRGVLELNLGPGERRSESLILLPLQGEGSLSLSWSILGDLGPGCLLRGRLSCLEGPEIPLSAPAELGLISIQALAAGSYTLELGLFELEERICGLADSILILSGYETRAELSFEPPEATLGLAFTEPVFRGPELSIRPLRRRVRPGLEASFRLPEWTGLGSWFLEGGGLPTAGEGLSLSLAEPGRRRIDWVGESPGLAYASGRAELIVAEGASLGPLLWAETLGKGDIEASAASASLDDCRDLAFSPDGSLLAAAGKERSAIGLFAYPGPGRLEALGGLGTREDSRLGPPSQLRFLPSGLGLLALSETEGALYRLALGAEGRELSLEAELAAAELLGAKDLALSPEGRFAYIASPDKDAIYLSPAESGAFLLLRAAGAGDPGLEQLSRPLSLAVSRDGALLALGTGGDDAIYFFHRDVADGSLSLLERVSKEALAALATLADPVSLAFSQDGHSLFILSYYGKALIRLDRDEGSGAFIPAAALKSGVAGVSGFGYPKRLALSPDGGLLLATASGATDGLSAFAVGARGQLDFLGYLQPDGSEARLGKPLPLAFSPEGKSLVLASAEEDRLAVYTAGP